MNFAQELMESVEAKKFDFTLLDLGKIPYEQAWEKQKELLDKRIKNEIPDTIIFCEHNPAVITLGRGAQRTGTTLQDLGLLALPPGVQVLPVERGGLATYHGPGQLVIYPIVKLADKDAHSPKHGVVTLIRWLEGWVIDVLQKKYHLDAGRVDDKTGVWIDGQRKIASIGIAARHWVSYHGLALNLSTGPEPWKYLNPCGLGSSIMTDLNMELERKRYGLPFGVADALEIS